MKRIARIKLLLLGSLAMTAGCDGHQPDVRDPSLELTEIPGSAPRLSVDRALLQESGAPLYVGGAFTDRFGSPPCASPIGVGWRDGIEESRFHGCGMSSALASWRGQPVILYSQSYAEGRRVWGLDPEKKEWLGLPGSPDDLKRIVGEYKGSLVVASTRGIYIMDSPEAHEILMTGSVVNNGLMCPQMISEDRIVVPLWADRQTLELEVWDLGGSKLFSLGTVPSSPGAPFSLVAGNGSVVILQQDLDGERLLVEWLLDGEQRRTLRETEPIEYGVGARFLVKGGAFIGDRLMLGISRPTFAWSTGEVVEVDRDQRRAHRVAMFSSGINQFTSHDDGSILIMGLQARLWLLKARAER